MHYQLKILAELGGPDIRPPHAKFILLSHYTKKHNKTDPRQVNHTITLLEDWLERKGE